VKKKILLLFLLEKLKDKALLLL